MSDKIDFMNSSLKGLQRGRLSSECQRNFLTSLFTKIWNGEIKNNAGQEKEKWSHKDAQPENRRSWYHCWFCPSVWLPWVIFTVGNLACNLFGLRIHISPCPSLHFKSSLEDKEPPDWIQTPTLSHIQPNLIHRHMHHLTCLPVLTVLNHCWIDPIWAALENWIHFC